MGDLKRASEELTAKAAFSAAKQAAERALEDALSSDEERAQRKVEQAALAKRKRTKLIVLGVVGFLLVLGVIGMVLSYWHWFLLLGLVGLLALYGRHRWRARREEKQETAASAPAEAAAPRALEPPVRVARRAAPEPREDDGEAIEDELARLKSRLDK